MGQGAGDRSSKQARTSWDPHSSKAKRAARTMPALTEEQKATACAERVAKCQGISPPHATDWGLGEEVRLPDPDAEGPRRCGVIRLSDDLLNKYAPLPREEHRPCVACFRRMNEGPWHECHVRHGRRVCEWCDLSEQKRCVTVSCVFLYV